MNSNGVLTIGRPRIEAGAKGQTRLVADVDIAGERRSIWLSVENRYARYLCHERSDAFVAGLLPVAFRRHLDIECEAPVGEHLLFQLRSYLIPLISKYGRSVWPVNIKAEVDCSVLSNDDGVGTGISCGVDCLHVLLNHANPEFPHLKITHLVLNNVGAFGRRGHSNQFAWSIDLAHKFCRETGYELIVIDSNIFDETGLDFMLNCTYLNVFPVLALQKLWRVFLLGSGGDDFNEIFTLVNNDDHCAEDVDLIILDGFSTPGLRIYSEGLPYTRMEKLRRLMNFPLAQKYLQVCVNGSGGNCGECFKCKRTLLQLDALGCLDEFSNVFDIKKYRRKRQWYLRYLYRTHVSGSDPMINGEVYQKLRKDISIISKVLGVSDEIVYRMKVALRPWCEACCLLKKRT